MQEEIFGPVVCVAPFDTEDEVVERANNVRTLIHPHERTLPPRMIHLTVASFSQVKYGLCAAVWGQKGDRLLRTAHRLQVGTVWVNCWLVRSLDMPFGGMKHSGIGREGTSHSLDLYTEETTICYKID